MALHILIAILKTDYQLCFSFSIKKLIKSMQKVLPSELASLQGRLVRIIASDRIFNLTVHCTLNSLINNDFNMYTVQYVKRFLSKK